MSGPVLAVVIAVGLLLLALVTSPVGPTVRAALLLGAAAVLAILVPPPVALLLGLGVVIATVVDAIAAHPSPLVTREVAATLARGVASPLVVQSARSSGLTVRIRQPRVPDLAIEPAEATGRLDARLVARRRGRHELPGVAVRATGPLGLASWTRSGPGPADVLVFPDLPAAQRLALAVRKGRFRDPGRLSRGPLGLGTEFESIRDYTADDDIRQVNWRATARLGRPMSNQYRVEQDRDVICVLDCGRLMAAPILDRTRLDAAVDAVAAIALVADEVGDRCGVVAFDSEIRRRLAARRSGGDGVVRAVFDLEPRGVDSDYELAFRTVAGGKRAFVLVLTDLLEEIAARPLVEAVPYLARRHAVVVASVSDPDLERSVGVAPASTHDVYAAAVALDVLDARARVSAQLRGVGAEVVEAAPAMLGPACVAAYLRAKTRGQL
jgi:uncharacterized protein (DUF58 family)